METVNEHCKSAEHSNIVTNLIKILGNSKHNTETTISEHYEKLDKVHDFIHLEFIPFVDKMNFHKNEYEFFKEIECAYSDWANITKKPWLREKTVIALMGRFSAGKTSIINALLGEKLLPTDVKPTTAIPTYISYSPKKRAQVLDYKDETIEVGDDVIKALSEENLEGFPISYIIRYIVAGYDNENLKEKSILDTPGYDPDRQFTFDRKVIQECSTVCWVIDIQDGDVSSGSLKYIKEYLGNIPLFFVLNKSDGKSPGERKKVLIKIQKTLKENDIKYEECLLYSSKNIEYKKAMEEVLYEKIQANSNSNNNNLKSLVQKTMKEIIEDKLGLIRAEKVERDKQNDLLEKISECKNLFKNLTNSWVENIKDNKWIWSSWSSFFYIYPQDYNFSQKTAYMNDLNSLFLELDKLNSENTVEYYGLIRDSLAKIKDFSTLLSPDNLINNKNKYFYINADNLKGLIIRLFESDVSGHVFKCIEDILKKGIYDSEEKIKLYEDHKNEAVRLKKSLTEVF